MKASKFLGRIGVMLLALLVLSLAVAALPVTVEEVQLDDVTVDTNSVNRLDLERDSQIDVEVQLRASEDVDNLELQVFLSGYEFNDLQRVSASLGTFSLEKDHTSVKKLSLNLPDDLEEGEYKLRLLLTDRDGLALVQDYNVKVDVPRHNLKVEDVVFFPGRTVKAGQALLTTVRLENRGEKTEDDVKVTVSLPELGLSNSDYVSKVRPGDEEETEEVYLRLDSDVKPGTYTLNVDVSYSQRRRSLDTLSFSVNVEEGAAEQSTSPQPEAQQQTTTVTVQQNVPQTQEVDTGANKLRKALEVVLLVLVALLVVVGLIIGFSKLRSDDNDEL